MMNEQDNAEPVRVRNGRRIHDLCSVVSREAMRRGQAALSDIGFSSGAYNLLRVLRDREDMTIADIKTALRVESATISTLVVRMERDGLIQKQPSPTDKRATLLKATPHALALVARADQITAVEAADMTHRLTDGEQIQLITLLERVLSNLSPST
jgi:MarR family transcriptional regulator, transcriptional regulator for hemolysin